MLKKMVDFITKRKSRLEAVDRFQEMVNALIETNDLTDKQIAKIERSNQKIIDDKLKEDMALFRKYVLNHFGNSRKKLLDSTFHKNAIRSKNDMTWCDFTMLSINFICGQYSVDIDILKGASDGFMLELHNPDTELTWTSGSTYYENKLKEPTLKKNKRSLDHFFDNETDNNMNEAQEKLAEIAKNRAAREAQRKIEDAEAEAQKKKNREAEDAADKKIEQELIAVDKVKVLETVKAIIKQYNIRPKDLRTVLDAEEVKFASEAKKIKSITDKAKRDAKKNNK